jgi:hypothetical protein
MNLDKANWRKGLHPEDIEADGQRYGPAFVFGTRMYHSHKPINYTAIFVVFFFISFVLSFLGFRLGWW